MRLAGTGASCFLLTSRIPQARAADRLDLPSAHDTVTRFDDAVDYTKVWNDAKAMFGIPASEEPRDDDDDLFSIASDSELEEDELTTPPQDHP